MVESEIAPLLQEYWFDSLEEADKAVENFNKFMSIPIGIYGG